MKTIVALFMTLSFVIPAHATTDERLMNALRAMRKRTVFIDLSPEGRLVARGTKYLQFGSDAIFAPGIGRGLNLRFAPSVALTGVFFGAIAAFGAGGVMYTAGRLVQVLTPRPRLGVSDPREYASPVGWNQFMRLKIAEQFEIARHCPPLAEYIVRVDDAFNTALKYGLLLSDPTP